MDCRTCQENISAYLDGELTASEAEQINKHCRQCVTCHSELKNTRALITKLHSLDVPVLKRDFAADLSFLDEPSASSNENNSNEKLAAAQGAHTPTDELQGKRREKRTGHNRQPRRWMALTAVFLVGMLVGFGSFELARSTNSPTVQETAAITDNQTETDITAVSLDEQEEAAEATAPPCNKTQDDTEDQIKTEADRLTLMNECRQPEAGCLYVSTVAPEHWEAITAAVSEPQEGLYLDVANEQTIILFCEVATAMEQIEDWSNYLTTDHSTLIPAEERSDWTQIQAEYSQLNEPGNDTPFDQQILERLMREKTMVKIQLTKEE